MMHNYYSRPAWKSDRDAMNTTLLAERNVSNAMAPRDSH
ncbi:hypothetical protein AAZX31_13G344100 [Glycine max]